LLQLLCYEGMLCLQSSTSCPIQASGSNTQTALGQSNGCPDTTPQSKFFRWHDSGDIQSLKHLAKIFAVARLTPDVNHWLPTREAWVKPYLSRAPKNLVIRFSMPMVDQPAAESWSHTSTVVSGPGRTCPAPDQDNACGECRACWDPNVKNVAYGKH
jgi:hypothetical protein